MRDPSAERGQGFAEFGVDLGFGKGHDPDLQAPVGRMDKAVLECGGVPPDPGTPHPYRSGSTVDALLDGVEDHFLVVDADEPHVRLQCSPDVVVGCPLSRRVVVVEAEYLAGADLLDQPFVDHGADRVEWSAAGTAYRGAVRNEVQAVAGAGG